MIGTTIDRRYVLRREIASGGMGVVFEAHQAYTGRAVALKLLHGEHADNPRIGERLLREARALGTIRHPNVVDVIDAGIDAAGDVYIATEMLDGRTLEGIIHARGVLAQADVVRVGRQVASALAVVHARGVIHRDVKPANVFVTRDVAGDEVVKLIDFGIASFRFSDSADPISRITVHGEMLGTPEYMAPEQLLGRRDVDRRSDVYSLGVTLFEALTGHVPHQGGVGEVLASLSQSSRARTLAALCPDVDPRLAAVIERAIAREPSDRFADATAFGEALRGAIDDADERTRLLGGTYVPPGTASTNGGAAAPEAAPQRAPAGAQRRRHVRAPYVSPARVLLGNHTHVDGRIEDISVNGMLLITPRELPRDEAVQVRFALPGTGAIAALPAVVRWVKSARGGRAAIGVEFLAVPDDVRRTLEMFVAMTGTAVAS